jgi:accessory gene regulator B
MEAAAKALTDRIIRYFGLPEERRDVLAFGVIHVFLYLIDAVGLLLACLLSRAPAFTLTAAFTSMSFRSLTGGAHLDNPWRCSVISFSILGLSGALAALLTKVAGPRVGALLIAVVGGCAAAAIWRYAPVDSPAKPLSEPQKRRLRKAAWLLLVIWAVWEGALLGRGYLGPALASGLGLFLQTGTLTPGEARLTRWIDQRFSSARRLKLKEAG